MDHLTSILPRVLGRRGLREHANAALVAHRVQVWIASRLPHLAAFITVQKLEEGTLFLMCAHSIASQECRGILPDLQLYIEKECRFTQVQTIRIARK